LIIPYEKQKPETEFRVFVFLREIAGINKG